MYRVVVITRTNVEERYKMFKHRISYHDLGMLSEAKRNRGSLSGLSMRGNGSGREEKGVNPLENLILSPGIADVTSVRVQFACGSASRRVTRVRWLSAYHHSLHNTSIDAISCTYRGTDHPMDDAVEQTWPSESSRLPLVL